MENENIVEKLISHFDNLSATARAFDVDRQEIQRWRRQGFIPYRRGEETESLTNGDIKAVEVWESAAKGKVK